MAEFTDVEVRILGERPGDNPALHNVEVRVDGSGRWCGQSRFDLDSLDPSDPKYGEALGCQLANPSLMRALDQAGLTRNGNIRLRLCLDGDPTAMHNVRWERMSLTISGISQPIAINSRIALSRYIDVEQPDEIPPDKPFFQLLFAVANPDGLKPEQVIDVEKEIGNFLAEFEDDKGDRRLQVSVLPGRTTLSTALMARIANQGWGLVPGNTTLQNVSAEIHKKYNGLHILAHGDFNPAKGFGALLLENDAGGKDPVTDSQLQSWITTDLQLIVFQACLTGAAAAEGRPPFTSLAPRLIRSGLPASVAMQDFIEMKDARTFFSGFYRALLDYGMVDIAVNLGRQQVIRSTSPDNWSIPALFSRLRGGRLWQTDILRKSTLTALDNLPETPDQWPELQVIEHKRGAAGYDPLQGASGPSFDLWNRIRDLAGTPGSFVIVTGAAGSSKSAQMCRLFRDAGEQFRDAKPNVPLPVYVTLSDLAGQPCPAWPVLDRIWNGQALPTDAPRIKNREFLFLIDAENQVNGPLREHALAAIGRLGDLAGSRVIIIADEELLPALTGFDDAKLLVVQPLDYTRVIAYLEGLKTDEASNLLGLLKRRGYWDLAGQPRLLEHMLDLISQGKAPQSRSAILEGLADSYLSNTNTRAVPRTCVENAAREISWAIQNGRSGELEGALFYASLNKVRGGREIPLSDLKDALVEDCELLTYSNDEGVRFVYAFLQAYFAACYLAEAPDGTRLLEDIAASLGKLSRLRRWEKVLVLLASMLPTSASLLRTILAGSSLMEGEQLFLAARCYQEAIGEHPPEKSLDDVLDLMVDSLIWRSSWDPHRPYADRRGALEHLIGLAAVSGEHMELAIPHLFAVAFDPVPGSAAGTDASTYDWSGMRQGAATGLARLQGDAFAYVNAHRPGLTEMMNAWEQLHKNPELMNGILLRDDPSLSVIAAFTITLVEGGEEELLSAYRDSKNDDVKWGIADAMSWFETDWIRNRVVEPWINTTPLKPGVLLDRDTSLRAAHICYLIQKSEVASPLSRDYLDDCLKWGSPRLQGRALRAYSKLQDPEIESWLRPLCEQILCRKSEKISTERMPMSEGDNPDLVRAALEALRDIGDADSIEAVRKSRVQSANNELRMLSFQIAEEMYWRLSGGLSRESSKPVTSQKIREETRTHAI